MKIHIITQTFLITFLYKPYIWRKNNYLNKIILKIQQPTIKIPLIKIQNKDIFYYTKLKICSVLTWKIPFLQYYTLVERICKMRTNQNIFFSFLCYNISRSNKKDFTLIIKIVHAKIILFVCKNCLQRHQLKC